MRLMPVVVILTFFVFVPHVNALNIFDPFGTCENECELNELQCMNNGLYMCSCGEYDTWSSFLGISVGGDDCFEWPDQTQVPLSCTECEYGCVSSSGRPVCLHTSPCGKEGGCTLGQQRCINRGPTEPTVVVECVEDEFGCGFFDVFNPVDYCDGTGGKTTDCVETGEIAYCMSEQIRQDSQCSGPNDAKCDGNARVGCIQRDGRWVWDYDNRKTCGDNCICREIETTVGCLCSESDKEQFSKDTCFPGETRCHPAEDLRDDYVQYCTSWNGRDYTYPTDDIEVVQGGQTWFNSKLVTEFCTWGCAGDKCRREPKEDSIAKIGECSNCSLGQTICGGKDGNSIKECVYDTYLFPDYSCTMWSAARTCPSGKCVTGPNGGECKEYTKTGSEYELEIPDQSIAFMYLHGLALDNKYIYIFATNDSVTDNNILVWWRNNRSYWGEIALHDAYYQTYTGPDDMTIGMGPQTYSELIWYVDNHTAGDSPRLVGLEKNTNGTIRTTINLDTIGKGWEFNGPLTGMGITIEDNLIYAIGDRIGKPSYLVPYSESFAQLNWSGLITEKPIYSMANYIVGGHGGWMASDNGRIYILNNFFEYGGCGPYSPGSPGVGSGCVNTTTPYNNQIEIYNIEDQRFLGAYNISSDKHPFGIEARDNKIFLLYVEYKTPSSSIYNRYRANSIRIEEINLDQLCPQECLPGTSFCEGYNAYLKRYQNKVDCIEISEGCYVKASNELWKNESAIELCPFGCESEWINHRIVTSKCKDTPTLYEPCEFAETKCDASGKYVIRCSTEDDGRWTWSDNREFCRWGCNNGLCLSGENECRSGDSRCLIIDKDYIEYRSERVENPETHNIIEGQSYVQNCVIENIGGDTYYTWSDNQKNWDFCEMGCTQNFNSTTFATTAQCINKTQFIDTYNLDDWRSSIFEGFALIEILFPASSPFSRYAFSLFISGIIFLFTAWYSDSMEYGITTASIPIFISSLSGWLPIYVIIIPAMITIFFVWKKIWGGSNE